MKWTPVTAVLALAACETQVVEEPVVTLESLTTDTTCLEGSIPYYDASQDVWSCRQIDITAIGATPVWSDIDASTVPEGLADGDDDLLATFECETDQILSWDGTEWTCVTPAQQQADTLSNLVCDSGEVVGWNGTSWACTSVAFTDADSLGALSCTDGEVAQYDQTNAMWVCANPTTDLADGDTLGDLGANCGVGEVAKWSGSAWACSTDTDTTYFAGTGVALVGTTFGVVQSVIEGWIEDMFADAGVTVSTNNVDLTASQTTVDGTPLTTAVQNYAATALATGGVTLTGSELDLTASTTTVDGAALQTTVEGWTSDQLGTRGIDISGGAADLQSGTAQLDGTTLGTALDSRTETLLSANGIDLNGTSADLASSQTLVDGTGLAAWVTSLVSGSAQDLASGTTVDGAAIVTGDQDCGDQAVLGFTAAGELLCGAPSTFTNGGAKSNNNAQLTFGAYQPGFNNRSVTLLMDETTDLFPPMEITTSGTRFRTVLRTTLSTNRQNNGLTTDYVLYHAIQNEGGSFVGVRQCWFEEVSPDPDNGSAGVDIMVHSECLWSLPAGTYTVLAEWQAVSNGFDTVPSSFTVANFSGNVLSAAFNHAWYAEEL